MVERSLFWDGITADGGPYNQAHLHDWFFRSVLNGDGNRGVLFGRWNSLEVYTSAGDDKSPLTVAEGAAIVHGMYYESDAPVTVSVPTPTAGTRIDLVVIRRSWPDKTCRVTRIVGVSGGAAATLTQQDGVTWDVPLASVSITTSGTVTITDTREYCEYSQALPDWSVMAEEAFYPYSITSDKVPNRTRWELKEAGQLDTESPGLYGAQWIGAGGLYGADYDHWRLDTDVTDSIWGWFLVPDTMEVGGSLNFYIWTAPDTNGLGAGAENVHWDYDIYYGIADTVPTHATAAVLADQQARLEANIYCDALALAMPVLGAPCAVGVRLTRTGHAADDTFKSPIRLLGIEARWTAVA